MAPQEGVSWDLTVHNCFKDIVHSIHIAERSGWDGKVSGMTCLDMGLLRGGSGTHIFQKDTIRPGRLKITMPFLQKGHEMFSLQHFPILAFPSGKSKIEININSLYSFLI